MRIPDQMLDCVGFISHDQPENIKYGGTAFIVGVRGVYDNVYLHIVTAAHVAEAVEHGGFILGMNSKEGGKLLLRSAGMRWWYHPTEKDHVDVAVSIFATPRFEEYSVQYISTKMFATPEVMQERGIGIGDELIAIGLFTRFSGQGRHFPIVRSGIISMMPDELVYTGKKYGHMEAYLAEGRSIGGLSGSPVLVRETVHVPIADQPNGPMKGWMHALGGFRLLGLVHGHWDTMPAQFAQIEQPEAVNMGISIVVPAHKILEVLHHPELVKMRKEFDDRYGAEKAPQMDSELKPLTKEEFEETVKKVSRKVEPKTAD